MPAERVWGLRQGWGNCPALPVAGDQRLAAIGSFHWVADQLPVHSP